MRINASNSTTLYSCFNMFQLRPTSSWKLRRLRLQASEALCVKEETSTTLDLTTFWGRVWSLAADFGPELLGEHSQCLRRQVPVRGEDGLSLASTELLILRMEAATFLILENPDASEALNIMQSFHVKRDNYGLHKIPHSVKDHWFYISSNKNDMQLPFLDIRFIGRGML